MRVKTIGLLLIALIAIALPVDKPGLAQQSRQQRQPAPSVKAGSDRSNAASNGQTSRSPAAPFIGRARQIILQGQDYPAAMRELDSAEQADPKNPFVYAWRGLAYNRQNKHAEGLPFFERALALDPKNLVALNGRGYAHYTLGDRDKALMDFNAAIAIDPHAPNAYANRALVEADQGDGDRAIADLTTAIQYGPDYAPAYADLGFVYNRMRQFEKAVTAFDQAIRLAPKNAAAYNGRGYAQLSLGNSDVAIPDFRQAIALAPKFIKPHGNLGRVYLDQHNAGAAIAEFNEVLKLDPRSVPALLGRSRVYESSGDLVKALADVEAALAIAPQHSAAQAALDRVKAKVTLANGGADGKARTGGRVALVIGNSKYQAVDELANPSRDAKLMADALSRSGFTTVRILIDGNRAQIASTLKTFAADAANADWAVIYYAGHGIELDGANYLVPVDVKYVDDDDIPKESVALDAVLNAVAGAAKMRLVMLDACRDNPFADKLKTDAEASTIGKGLARIEPESGTLVAFATKHGHVATDGSGSDSPFATALAKRIPTPGLEISRLFRLVHDDVYASTNKEQEPFTYGQLSAEEFYFQAR